ncbi:class I SAM-dependent methyltransferase [Streptacidiphilus anmyonensis]|uniref:class I SAM-dependent methyltransferase n=1 Tax=Streptacidiphilus anmyonensis TaxID=405782 RepID=UPI0005A9F91E|nr:class I SAM-dependent methyltransferase [Streptacidiphilus anmyonensis]
MSAEEHSTAGGWPAPAEPAEALFTEIFQTNHWGSSESVSGPGSELRQTEAVRAALASVLARYPIRTVTDVGCGDVNWIRHVDGFDQLDRYIGLDVVADLVRRNQERYGNERVSFRQADLSRDEIPAADLVIARDCLVHLTHHEALAFLDRLAASSSTWLLTTTYVGLAENRDTTGSHWRPLNLQTAPFCLPAPTLHFDTDFTDNGRHHPGNGLGLWKIDQLRARTA